MRTASAAGLHLLPLATFRPFRTYLSPFYPYSIDTFASDAYNMQDHILSTVHRRKHQYRLRYQGCGAADRVVETAAGGSLR
jgi:hypothetical protein